MPTKLKDACPTTRACTAAPASGFATATTVRRDRSSPASMPRDHPVDRRTSGRSADMTPPMYSTDQLDAVTDEPTVAAPMSPSDTYLPQYRDRHSTRPANSGPLPPRRSLGEGAQRTRGPYWADGRLLRGWRRTHPGAVLRRPARRGDHRLHVPASGRGAVGDPELGDRRWSGAGRASRLGHRDTWPHHRGRSVRSRRRLSPF